MKISDIIENKQQLTILPRSAIRDLWKYCGHFLKTTHTPLYRGIQRLPALLNAVAEIPIRSNRRPVDSGTIDTATFNYAFEMKFGLPRIRNTSVFATSNRGVASAYGSVMLVIPRDGSKYAFNNNVSDLFITQLAGLVPFWAFVKNNGEANSSWEAAKEFSNSVLASGADATTINKQLPASLRQDWIKYVSELNKRTINGYQVTDNPSEIPTECEVMITGVSSYFGVDTGSIIAEVSQARKDGMTIYIGDVPLNARFSASNIFAALLAELPITARF